MARFHKSTLLFLTLTLAPFLMGQTEVVLHTFTGGRDGALPVGSLVFDQDGNLYGTTYLGGGHTAGVVFELSPSTGGEWTETVLYRFTGGSDGLYPVGNLILDKHGNLYGLTEEGGQTNSICPYGCGVVYELKKMPSGRWEQKVLHAFQGSPTDGVYPIAGPTFGPQGVLYGTTNEGGTGTMGQGVVFQLTPDSSGAWTEKVIFDLDGGSEGSQAVSGLATDVKGQFYGTTCCTYGAVYEVSHGLGGNWTASGIFDFSGGLTGNGPYGGVTFDSSGRLFGPAGGGGVAGLGIVYELTPSSGGTWTEDVLYSFSGGSDGEGPASGVILDSLGNVYGTTTWGGGSGNCDGENIFCGTVYELSPTANGMYSESILYRFGGGEDGGAPAGSLVSDSAGNLYGMTSAGGDTSCDEGYGCGVVFEIVR